LLTVENGVKCENFCEAAKEMGLVADDAEWKKCLEEAVAFQMPKQVRTLFAMLLIHCHPSNPVDLWEFFKESMCEDFARKYSAEVAEALAYNEIDERLREFNNTFAQHGVDKPDVLIPNVAETIDRREAKRIGDELYDTLEKSPEQMRIVDAILEVATVRSADNENNCFFIDGPGGCGKTHIYRTIYNILIGRGDDVNCMAYTGIAATLLPTGRTIHTMFGIPFNSDQFKCQCSISLQSERGQVLKNSKVIICDEAPMAPAYMYEAIDRFLQDLMKNTRPFGGKIVLFGGDWRQTLPVVKGGMRANLLAASVKFSPLWKNFKVEKLTKNMRADEDQQHFADYLLEMGEGRLPTNGHDEIELDEGFITKDGIIRDVFGDKIVDADIRTISKRAILCSTNADAFRINNEVLKLFPGKEEKFLSIDEVDLESCGGDPTLYTTEFLNSQTPHSLPRHDLRLKLNVVVMLLRNFDVRRGLCNGTRLIVRDMKEHVLRCETIDGFHKGEHVLIPRFILDSDDFKLPVQFTRRQFPLRVSFAMTINKSQGQTFDRVGVMLEQPVFSHGQLYVAFSRVRNRHSITVQLPQTEGEPLNRWTKNIVYKEIFSDRFQKQRTTSREENAVLKAELTKQPRPTTTKINGSLSRKRRQTAISTADSISTTTSSIDNIPALPNDNRSCYANAVLQCLYRLFELYESITAATFLDVTTNRIAVALRDAVTRVRGKTVRKLRDLIGHPFSTNQDQDAVEFLEHLLTIFACKSQFYAFSASTQKNCAICGFHTVIRQRFDHLRLSALGAKGPLNFHTLLNASIEHLSFPDEDRINCKRCRELTVSNDHRFMEHKMPQ
jgi:hypothetical protein